MKRYFPFIAYLLVEGVLQPRYRELAILRVAWIRQTEYEWTQHVMIARKAGVSDDEIRRIAGPFDAKQWGAPEASVIQAVGELIDTARISDETWNGLIANLDTKQVIELIHVIGNYDLIAMFMNVTGLELEPGLEEIRFKAFADG
jgi:alkylhydroperoxidase family enzyme